MEREALRIKLSFVALPIARIIHDWMADGRHVYSNLVRPACLERETHQGARRALEVDQYLVPGPCVSTIRSDSHASWCRRRTANGSVNDPLTTFEVAFNHSEIPTLHRALCELRSE